VPLAALSGDWADPSVASLFTSTSAGGATAAVAVAEPLVIALESLKSLARIDEWDEMLLRNEMNSDVGNLFS
jgi:hypothetical protein